VKLVVKLSPHSRKPITLSVASALLLVSGTVYASGNFPEAGTCPPEKPYFAFCLHSFHSLEGWYSSHCHSTREAAQRDAEAHAREYHHGNMRWTGVKKQR
jgi:hypothetical protein